MILIVFGVVLAICLGGGVIFKGGGIVLLRGVGYLMRIRWVPQDTGGVARFVPLLSEGAVEG